MFSIDRHGDEQNMNCPAEAFILKLRLLILPLLNTAVLRPQKNYTPALNRLFMSS